MTHGPYFNLAFRPNIAVVSTVRRFTTEFYRRTIADDELAQRVALATHELLENAVAYATDEETEIRIEVVGDQLVVKTWNRALPERLARLRAAMDEMNAEPDADRYYQKLLIRASKSLEGSGLGLARVRAEAEMQLRYEIDQDRVCVMATTKVAGGREP